MKNTTWSVLEYDTRVVVVPTTDYDYHGESDEEQILDTDDCHCSPEIRKDDWNTKKMIIHNAWDGREWKELADTRNYPK